MRDTIGVAFIYSSFKSNAQNGVMEYFKHSRQLLGVSQRALAQLAGVDHSMISRVEAGKVRPGQEFLERCESVLGVLLPRPAPAPSGPKLATDGLRSLRRSVLRAFPPSPPSFPSPLRQAFGAVRSTAEGARLVERLDRQGRSASQWVAIREIAGFMHGAEQAFLLQALLKGGLMQETEPRELELPLPTACFPRRRSLALHLGPCIDFPQLMLALPYNPSLDAEARKICHPRLDFLIAVATRPRLFVDLELNGPHQRGRKREDAARARAIGLPQLTLPVAGLTSDDFWRGFVRELRSLVEREGRVWPRCRRSD